MKAFEVLMLTLALSILLAGIIACKDNSFGVSRKRIIIRKKRRCKGSSSARTIKTDVRNVKKLGKKLKNALKTMVADLQSNKKTKKTNTGQD
jgi:hypothetical protein